MRAWILSLTWWTRIYPYHRFRWVCPPPPSRITSWWAGLEKMFISREAGQFSHNLFCVFLCIKRQHFSPNSKNFLPANTNISWEGASQVRHFFPPCIWGPSQSYRPRVQAARVVGRGTEIIFWLHFCNLTAFWNFLNICKGFFHLKNNWFLNCWQLSFFRHVFWWKQACSQGMPGCDAPGGGYSHRNAIRGCAAQMGRFLTKNP